jgi:hypothetical protein
MRNGMDHFDIDSRIAAVMAQLEAGNAELHFDDEPRRARLWRCESAGHLSKGSSPPEVVSRWEVGTCWKLAAENNCYG